MRIVVNHRYTYDTGRHKVALGDTVTLPTASWLRDTLGPTFDGKVTALTSDYTGDCVTILGVRAEKTK